MSKASARQISSKQRHGLSKTAQENLQKHIHEVVPEEYQDIRIPDGKVLVTVWKALP